MVLLISSLEKSLPCLVGFALLSVLSKHSSFVSRSPSHLKRLCQVSRSRLFVVDSHVAFVSVHLFVCIVAYVICLYVLLFVITVICLQYSVD